MRFDPEGVLESALTAYGLGDLPAATAYFSDDAMLSIYVDQDVLPFGGEICGKRFTAPTLTDQAGILA